MNFCHNIRSNYIITKLVKCQYFLATFKTFEGNELKKRWDGERRCGAKSSLKLCLLWDFAWLAFLFQLFFQKFRPYLALLRDYIAIHMTTANSFIFVVETCSLCDLIMFCGDFILYSVNLWRECSWLQDFYYILFFIKHTFVTPLVERTSYFHSCKTFWSKSTPWFAFSNLITGHWRISLLVCLKQ